MKLSKIKVLTFDIGGTVFDWHGGVRQEMERLSKELGVKVDASHFAQEWRNRMFELLAMVRSGELPWMNADELHRRALDDVAPNHPSLRLSDGDKGKLNRVWHRLKAWDGAADAINRLRTRYTVSVLTVMSFGIAVDCSKLNGVQWDAIISCEFLGHYKPDPSAYQAGVKLLGYKPDEAMMVAAHYNDLRASARAGLHTAFVARPLEKGEGGKAEVEPQSDFDFNATDFADLASQLVG